MRLFSAGESRARRHGDCRIGYTIAVLRRNASVPMIMKLIMLTPTPAAKAGAANNLIALPGLETDAMRATAIGLVSGAWGFRAGAFYGAGRKRARKLMKLFVASVAIAMMVGVSSGSAAVRITDDPGGQIGPYLDKYRALRASGEKVVIDGSCASACTMILGILPRNRICVTPRAVLEFHTAWDPSPSGELVVSSAGDSILWSTYPSDIRRWIRRHGGLRREIIALHGRELDAIIPPCR